MEFNKERIKEALSHSSFSGFENTTASCAILLYHNTWNQNFKFQRRSYHYFCHRYNTTWKNERAVEVPIIWDIVRNFTGRILELGNVLSHYYPVTHYVVDKYEKAKGVINSDVVNLRPTIRYAR